MERRVHLKGRLLAMAQCVNNSRLLADIGSDHGRLCVSLLQSGRAHRAYATDISADSLEKARQLCCKCKLEDRMHFMVTDGLRGFSEQPDTIIIAGMGGQLISEILRDSPDVARAAGRLILQPMRGAGELRKYLHDDGYAVDREFLCRDAGRMYQIICAHYDGCVSKPRKFPNGFYELGEGMLCDPLLSEYLEALRREASRNVGNALKHGVILEDAEQFLKDLEYIADMVEEGNNEA